MKEELKENDIKAKSNKMITKMIFNENIVERYCKLIFYDHEKIAKDLKNYINELQENKDITEIKKMIDYMRLIHSYVHNIKSTSARQMFTDKYLSNTTLEISCVNPFDKTTKIQFADKICVVNSGKYPMIYKFIETNAFKETRYVNIMYKHGNDLTIDIFVLKLAKIVAQKVNLEILTYKIIPFSRRDGIIQMLDVKDCSNIDKLKFILYKNEDNLQKFVKTFTFWLVFSFLVGIGDRTEKNMLFTKNGDVIYIDFSYVLGDDPKFKIKKFVIPHVIGKLISQDKDLQEKCIAETIGYFKNIRNNFSNISQSIDKLLKDPIYLRNIYSVQNYIKKRLFFSLDDNKCEYMLTNMFLYCVNDYVDELILYMNRIGVFIRK